MGTATDNPSQFSHSAERAEACSDIVFYLSGPLHSCQEPEKGGGGKERQRERQGCWSEGWEREKKKKKKDGELRGERAVRAKQSNRKRGRQLGSKKKKKSKTKQGGR